MIESDLNRKTSFDFLEDIWNPDGTYNKKVNIFGRHILIITGKPQILALLYFLIGPDICK